MKTAKILFTLLLLQIFNSVFAWGPTGHRVVAEIAFHNIKESTKEKIANILNHQSLAMVSTFSDEIKSDDKYKKFSAWHYVNFSTGKKYEECEHSSEGDLIQGINTCITKIKSSETNAEDKAFYLKMLVHLIGDLHQPFHVGRENDRGGNDIKVMWFYTPSNIHRVWDEDMISQYMMSYSELANNLLYMELSQKQQIQSGTLMDWVYESQSLADSLYNKINMNDNLGYKYQYENFDTVKLQLQKGGLRLAKLLDELF